MRFSKVELRHLFIAALVLGFLFSFRLWGDVFSVGVGLTNWFKFFLVVIISLLICTIIQKKIAERLMISSEYRLWQIKRYGFRSKEKYPSKFLGYTINALPIGVIVGLLLIFASNGKLIFAAVGSSIVYLTRERVGKRFKNILNIESGKIALIGPLVSLLLAFIFKVVHWNDFVLVNSYLAIFNMVPFP